MKHRALAATALACVALGAAPVPAFAGQNGRTYSTGCDSRIKGIVTIKAFIHTYDHGQSVSIEPDTAATLEVRDCRTHKLMPKVPLEMDVSIDDEGWGLGCDASVGTGGGGVTCSGGSRKKTLTFNTITSTSGVARFRLSPNSDYGFVDGTFGDSTTTRINVRARVRGVEVGPTEAHGKA